MDGMRRLVPVMALALVAALPAASATPRFRATLTTAGHHPKIVVKWRYTLRVTDAKGKPLRARISVQVRDPLGSIHPIPFGRNTTNITNYAIRGTFRDWVNWPRDSGIGIRLTFRVIVKTAYGRRLLTYWVSPHA